MKIGYHPPHRQRSLHRAAPGFFGMIRRSPWMHDLLGPHVRFGGVPDGVYQGTPQGSTTPPSQAENNFLNNLFAPVRSIFGSRISIYLGALALWTLGYFLKGKPNPKPSKKA